MMKNTKLLAMLIASTAMMASCMEETPVTPIDSVPDDVIRLVMPQDEIQTRGTAVNTTTLGVGQKFRIYASSYTGSAYVSLLPDNFGVVDADNTKASLQNASGTATTYYWPTNSVRARFICYHPYNATGVTPTYTATTPQLALAYIAPTTFDGQQDLLFATTEVNKNTGVSLLFKHALTKVTFEGIITGNASGNVVKVNSVEIANARSKRNMTIGASGAWSAATLTDKITYKAASLNKTLSTSYSSILGTNVATDTKVFLMIPMTKTEFGTDTKVNVNVTIGTTPNAVTKTCSFVINTTTYPDWEMGKHVNYRFSIDVSKEAPVIQVTKVEVEAWGTQQNVDVGVIN